MTAHEEALKRGEARRWTAAVLLAGVTACSLTTDFSGLSSGGPALPDGGAVSSGDAAEASVDHDGAVSFNLDAGVDGSKGEVLATGGVVVATGVSAYAAGSAQQHHVHFATNLGAWVVFYLSVSQPNAIATRITTDFVSFVDGPSIALPHPHSGEGRNFDVAYANIAGADIFHLVVSMHDGNRFCYHARGRGIGGTLSFDAMTKIDQSASEFPDLDPDAPTATILSDGKVLVSSGFNNVNGHIGNFVVYPSSKPDDGAPSWDHSLGAGIELEVAVTSVNARALVSTGAGGALGLWERAQAEPKPQTVAYALFDGIKWSAITDVQFPPAAYDVADWSPTTTNDGRIHLMRWAAGTYSHKYYDGAGHDGLPVPAASHSEGDGLVLLPTATGITAVAFALDANKKALRRSMLTATAWSAWENVAVADPTRSHISGNGRIVMWERRVDASSAADLVALRLP